MTLIEILDDLIESGLKIKNTEKLFEIFDFENKELPKIHQIGSKNIFEFEVDINEDQIPIYVTFEPITTNYIDVPPLLQKYDSGYEIAYGISPSMIDSQFAITDLQTISFIMFTLVEVVKKFIQNTSPDLIVFFARSKDGTIKGAAQKLNMYREIVKKYCPTEYAVMDGIRNKSGKPGFLIYKRDRFHGKNRKK